MGIAQLPLREAVIEAVALTIAPYLGKTMAQAAVESHGQKLGIDGTHVTVDQLEALFAKLSAGLVIFVGRERTDLIVREARAAVDNLKARS